MSSHPQTRPGPGVEGPVRAEPSVSVIVLGYGAEAYLADCLMAISPQLRDGDEIVLVDNGIDSAAASALPETPSLRRLRPETNLGFAGGCNLAVVHSTGDLLVFVNSDAILRPEALDRLRTRAVQVDGIVCGCLRLADRPELVNSVGNPLHFIGLTWAGHCGEVATEHLTPGPVAVATGGFFALSRAVWEDLGGFSPEYFAYHEDTDLSLRCWLSGRRVEVWPGAVADHHYEFGRSPLKMYLLERNRWQTILIDYPADLLASVLPALILLEPLLFLLAITQGWAGQKAAAWWWVLRHQRSIRQRRREVQVGVRIDTVVVAAILTDRIEPSMVAPPPGMATLNRWLAAYWRRARAALDRRRASAG